MSNGPGCQYDTAVRTFFWASCSAQMSPNAAFSPQHSARPKGGPVFERINWTNGLARPLTDSGGNARGRCASICGGVLCDKYAIAIPRRERAERSCRVIRHPSIKKVACACACISRPVLYACAQDGVVIGAQQWATPLFSHRRRPVALSGPEEAQKGRHCAVPAALRYALAPLAPRSQ